MSSVSAGITFSPRVTSSTDHPLISNLVIPSETGTVTPEVTAAYFLDLDGLKLLQISPYFAPAATQSMIMSTPFAPGEAAMISDTTVAEW